MKQRDQQSLPQTLFVKAGGHPSHMGFASEITAKVYPYFKYSNILGNGIWLDLVNSIKWPQSRVTIAEGTRPLFPQMVARQHRSQMTSIYLAADQLLYHIVHSQENLTGGKIEHAGRVTVRQLLRKLAPKGIDGVIAVSRYIAELIRPYLSEDTPIEVAHPYIQPEKYRSLSNLEPNLDSNIAVTTSRSTHYKGIDLLVDAWPSVRNDHPDAKLYIVGDGHPERFDEVEGVQRTGYVQDLTDIYEKASLYVHPARTDAFGVTVVEAMHGGLAPLVTSTTGSRSEVDKVNSDHVVEPRTSSLAKGVSTYFDRSYEARKNISEHSRERGEAFNPTRRKREFRKAFGRILAEKGMISPGTVGY